MKVDIPQFTHCPFCQLELKGPSRILFCESHCDCPAKFQHSPYNSEFSSGGRTSYIIGLYSINIYYSQNTSLVVYHADWTRKLDIHLSINHIIGIHFSIESIQNFLIL